MIHCTTYHAGSPTTTNMPVTSATTINEPSIITTTKQPVTTTFDMSTTTEETHLSPSPTTEGQRASSNVTNMEICSQNTSPGAMAGIAVGGVLTGALITIIVAILVLVVIRATRNFKDSVTLIAINPNTKGGKDEEETKATDSPEYSYVLTNPAILQHQIEMGDNECYATTRRPKLNVESTRYINN